MTANAKRGFYFSEHHVGHARRNIELFPWAQQAYESWRQQCERWMGEVSEQQIYDCVLGMKEEAFAYGISGCPACGKAFPMNPEGQRGMFSPLAELPAKSLTCPSCRTVLPNEQFADDGQGLEVGSKAYYLIGMWNFYYSGELLGGVRNHEGLVTKLTYMYMLTGDARYARRAIVILDAYSAIFPNTIGPRDFTAFKGEFEIGRLHLLTSIVHRIKVCLALDYDWLSGLTQWLDIPSPSLERLGMTGTIRHNIEAMLNDYMLTEPGGPYYDLKDGNLTNLQNHESDGVRAMLAVGLALDNESYCRWGRDAVEAYFYNAIGRDGMYYEGSYGYSLFTGTIFLDIALLAMKASSEEQLAEFHPFECDRFFRFAVANPLEMLCHGRLPSYGDWGRDLTVGREADPKLLLEAYRSALYFYQFTPSDELRDKARSCMLQLYPQVKHLLGVRGIDLFFQHPEDAEGQSDEAFELPKHNTVMGQTGIGILRGVGDATILLRLGPNLTHAHDDVLAYQFYDCGKEISADLGYGIYGTNAHLGWGSKAIAHNTVVVNKDSMMKAGQLFKPFSGGEFTFVRRTDSVTAYEGEASHLYGVDDYRRMLAIASCGDARSYVVDFFHVAGAETMDYAFHAFHEPSTLGLTGAAEKEADHWTLAGVDAEQKLYYDEPGKSFGERLTTGETFSELLEGEEPRLWTPDCNNGYGYIFNVKEFEPREQFVEAKWQAESGTVFRWIGLSGEGDRFFTGLCPSLEGDRRHPMLVQRSVQRDKTFAAVSITADTDASASELEVSAIEAEGRSVTAIAVKLGDGSTDYWVYSPETQVITAKVRGKDWIMEGRCAWMRLDEAGSVLGGSCLYASMMRYGGWEMPGMSERWLKVVQVNEEEASVWISAEDFDLDPEVLDGGYVKVRSSERSRTALMPVQRAEREGSLLKLVLRDSLIVSKGIVLEADEAGIDTAYPLPFGVQEQEHAESPFRGKWIKGQFGGLAQIVRVPELKRIEAVPVHPFQSGERFHIVELREGCELMVLPK